ncbi:hypothetical protein [Terribacillus saccharophilus]|uniref:hypothetical protein n=1 Tax=Terribacillus saccharophilus TaxID=361277 RepID=UPI003D27E816
MIGANLVNLVAAIANKGANSILIAVTLQCLGLLLCLNIPAPPGVIFILKSAKKKDKSATITLTGLIELLLALLQHSSCL